MSDKWKYIGFNDTWLLLLGIPLLTVVLNMLFFIDPSDSWELFFRRAISSSPFTIMYWISWRWVMIKFRERYNKFEHTPKRLMYIVLLIFLFAPIMGGGLNFLMDLSSEVFGYERTMPHPDQEKVLPTYFACFFMIAVYEAIYFYFQLKQSIEEKEQAKQAQIRAELEGLRNQVNPHFLFNSMNTLMNIVMEDQHLAVNFLGKLSKVYRYVLENRAEQIIPLSKELDFIHSYIFLQKERFRGNLEVQIDIPTTYLSRHIIPLSLQILFENAIKHNVIARKKPLLIELFVEDNKLVVKNNKQLKEQVMDSTKVGLENIKTRYHFFTEESIEVLDEEHSFSVKIPLLIN